MVERLSFKPVPTPLEAAAIAAALSVFASSEARKEPEGLRRERWRLAGLLQDSPPDRLEPGESLWAYSNWKGMV